MGKQTVGIRRIVSICSALAVGVALGSASTAFTQGAPPATAAAPGGTNLALGGVATQSSTLHSAEAARAIDGNTDGNFRNRSVTHTADEVNPYWDLALPAPVDVGVINVWNRTGCCQNRLSDFWVFTSTKPFGSTNPGDLRNDPNVMSYHITSTPLPEVAIQIGKERMQYVRIQIEAKQVLSLAEVELLPPSAGAIIATQSSNLNAGGKGQAPAAVDGNTNGNFRSGSVTHTAPGDDNPWWNAQITGGQQLRSLTVWNRTDCCKDRLQTVTVNVSTSSSNACKKGADFVFRLNVGGRTGRRLSLKRDDNGNFPVVTSVCIQKNTEILSLAEVQFAFGEFTTEGDDVVELKLDEIYTGWTDRTFTRGGNDTINAEAAPWGESAIAKFRNDKEWGVDNRNWFKYERLAYGGTGDDQFNMIFTRTIDANPVRSGHHMFGDEGTDTFNFVGVNNIAAGITEVGRIDDFDVTRDKIQIDGSDIDLNNLPGRVRIVAYNGDYGVADARPQQWILIQNNKGGYVFYSLEGSRYGANQTTDEERPFITTVPDFASLPDVVFQDVYPSVPYSEYASLDPAAVAEHVGRDRSDDPAVRNTGFGRIRTVGSNDSAIVDVVHGGAGSDYVLANGGNDQIAGGNSDDILWGQDGDDRIWSGTEHDETYGGNGNDYIEGNDGNDLLLGQAGNDQILGGPGTDDVYGDSPTDPAAGSVWLAEASYTDATIRDYIDGAKAGEVFEITPQRAAAWQPIAVDDDDNLLQRVDTTRQRITMDLPAGRAGTTYAYPDGFYNALNTTTGRSGRLFRIRLDPNYGGGSNPGGDDYLYVFETSINPGIGESVRLGRTIANVGNLNYPYFGVVASGPTSEGGDDILDGGDGDDFLTGGVGSDTLTGGAGADTFTFDANSGDDRIVDFEPGVDKIKFVGVGPGDVNISDGDGQAVVAFGANRIVVDGQSAATLTTNDLIFT